MGKTSDQVVMQDIMQTKYNQDAEMAGTSLRTQDGQKGACVPQKQGRVRRMRDSHMWAQSNAADPALQRGHIWTIASWDTYMSMLVRWLFSSAKLYG
jgi:hypothetical protein